MYIHVRPAHKPISRHIRKPESSDSLRDQGRTVPIDLRGWILETLDPSLREFRGPQRLEKILDQTRSVVSPACRRTQWLTRRRQQGFACHILNVVKFGVQRLRHCLVRSVCSSTTGMASTIRRGFSVASAATHARLPRKRRRSWSLSRRNWDEASPPSHS
jgi:hypothetical protein